MQASYILPSDKNKVLVQHYLSMKNNSDKCEDRFVPDGKIGIVFNIRSVNKYVKIDKSMLLPSHFITVPLMKSLIFTSTCDIESFIVICKASVFTKIFRFAFDESITQPFITKDIFDGFPMFEKLSKLKTFEERCSFFDKFLEENYSLETYEEDMIDIVYNMIMESNGNIKISELLTKQNTNERTFRRNFHKRVGMSAKELLRIVRVNYVWRLFTENRNVDFNSIVYQCHFFDQSHFIKDFKEIIGETPNKFFKRELSKVEFISGRYKSDNVDGNELQKKSNRTAYPKI